MSAMENLALVRRLVEEGMGHGGSDVAVGAYASNFIYHNPVLSEMPSLSKGSEGVRALIGMTHAAFPDLTYTIDVVVADEEQVALFYSWASTQVGPMGPIPPSGRRVNATGAIFCRLVGGKIVEQWHTDDRLSVMQQLGMIPDTTPSGPR